MRPSSVAFASLVLLNQSSFLVSFNFMKVITTGQSRTRRGLNRIFCDFDELKEQGAGSDLPQSLVLKLNETDNRCKHIKTILKLNVGDTLKGGVIDVGSTDDGKILEITADSGISISFGSRSDLKKNERPLVDLILAVPRPLRLERILSVVSCLGVGNLVLIGASKVQNDYFGSHLFRRPEEMKKCLVEGMSQASIDCMLPNVLVRKNFFKFSLAEMDTLFPQGEYHRIVAHPPSDTIDSNPIHISSLSRGSSAVDYSSIDSGLDASIPSNTHHTKKKVVVAVGPEGGWEDEEVMLLIEKGFQLVSLGPRILRTDIAVSVLLGLAHEWTDNSE